MAKKKSAGLWIAIVGGAAAVGLGIYFATRPSTPAAAAIAPTPVPTPTPTPPPVPATAPAAPAPPSTTYRLQISGDASVALRVGESVQFVLPPVPAGADSWSVAVENHNGQMASLGNMAFVAQSPGVSVIRFTPTNRIGGGVGIAGYNVTVTIGATSLQG